MILFKFYLLIFIFFFFFLCCFGNFMSLNIFKIISLVNFVVLFFVSCIFFIFINEFTDNIQYVNIISWFTLFFNINLLIGIDSLSVLFLILTNLLIILCLLVSWYSINYFYKEFILILFVVSFCINLVFMLIDFFFFYIFFESLLIPMFVIIGIWGSRLRRIEAAYQFFFFTLFGSIFTLLILIYLWLLVGSTNIIWLNHVHLSIFSQILMFMGIWLTFVIKIPLYPLHIWLPEAHVEAPTFGSVLLAGILLKLGGYGFLRFVFGFLPEASLIFQPLIFCLASLGTLYTSILTLRQIDLKKIIAYASVSHMNFALIGLFCYNLEGWIGSVYLMFSHGLVSSGLFIIVGFLYDRYKTRLLHYYGGLASLMPLFSSCLFVFSLANMSFPGTANFVGELLVFFGIGFVNFYVIVICLISTVFGTVYSLWLFNRVCFYRVSSFINFFSDLNMRELFIMCWLILLVFYFGFFPSFILNKLEFLFLKFFFIS